MHGAPLADLWFVNYLAHAWLAAPGDDWILGAFLGDHVRGDRWREFPPTAGAGILLHRRLDGFLDDTREWQALRTLFKPPFRRYAGILLDLAFDHLLARDWGQYATGNLQAFCDECYRVTDENWSRLPQSLQRFLRYARTYEVLSGYSQRSIVAQALAGIGGRLSHANPLHEAWPEIASRLDRIEAGFDALWPKLQACAAAERERLAEDLDSPHQIKSG